MVLRCTKKLLDEYGIKESTEFESDELYSWHMDMFYLNRKKCIILMNDATKFCTMIFDVPKKIFNTDFIPLWLREFLGTAAIFRLSADALEKYMFALMQGDGIALTKTTNRSIVSYLVKYKERIKCVAERYIKDNFFYSLDLNAYLNNYPIMSEHGTCSYTIFARRLKEQYGYKTHRMNLNPQPFESISEGKKVYEVRLDDEKRQKLSVLDEIIFVNTENKKELRKTILSIKCFPSFKDLFAEYRYFPRVLGCQDDCTESDFVLSMYQYYSPADELKYGVMAIHLED